MKKLYTRKTVLRRQLGILYKEDNILEKLYTRDFTLGVLYWQGCILERCTLGGNYWEDYTRNIIGKTVSKIVQGRVYGNDLNWEDFILERLSLEDSTQEKNILEGKTLEDWIDCKPRELYWKNI